MENENKCCYSCGELKSIDDFYKSDISRYNYCCKPCKAAYQREKRKNDWRLRIYQSGHRYDMSKGYETLKNPLTTLDKIRKKQNGKCYWFDIDIDFTKKNALFSPSLDRLDNSKGHVEENVVLTTIFANYARNAATVEEMSKSLYSIGVQLECEKLVNHIVKNNDTKIISTST